jgi:hypothetical protein
MATCILITLLALGMPLSWKKTELNTNIKWLGFNIDINSLKVTIPGDKMNIIQGQLQKVISGNPHSKEDVQKLVGRLQWATAAYPLTKPWLQPFWSWMTALKKMGKPGRLLQLTAKTMVHILSLQSYSPSPYSTSSPWHGATDAGADGERATVGGWLTDNSEATKEMVWWFMEEIGQAKHPWAFDKGSPQKKISSLELYGSMVLVKLILAKNKGNPATIPIFTDNQGNALALLSNRSKKWPNAAFIMDLNMTLHMAGSHIRPNFVKREFNEWADQLTHGDSSGFDEAKRLQPPQMSEWPIFVALMKAYESTLDESPQVPSVLTKG